MFRLHPYLFVWWLRVLLVSVVEEDGCPSWPSRTVSPPFLTVRVGASIHNWSWCEMTWRYIPPSRWVQKAEVCCLRRYLHVSMTLYPLWTIGESCFISRCHRVDVILPKYGFLRLKLFDHDVLTDLMFQCTSIEDLTSHATPNSPTARA